MRQSRGQARGGCASEVATTVGHCAHPARDFVSDHLGRAQNDQLRPRETEVFPQGPHVSEFSSLLGSLHQGWLPPQLRGTSSVKRPNEAGAQDGSCLQAWERPVTAFGRLRTLLIHFVSCLRPRL